MSGHWPTLEVTVQLRLGWHLSEGALGPGHQLQPRALLQQRWGAQSSLHNCHPLPCPALLLLAEPLPATPGPPVCRPLAVPFPGEGLPLPSYQALPPLSWSDGQLGPGVSRGCCLSSCLSCPSCPGRPIQHRLQDLGRPLRLPSVLSSCPQPLISHGLRSVPASPLVSKSHQPT